MYQEYDCLYLIAQCIFASTVTFSSESTAPEVPASPVIECFCHWRAALLGTRSAPEALAQKAHELEGHQALQVELPTLPHPHNAIRNHNVLDMSFLAGAFRG
eukprot:2503182-Rhodomonas_salina.2